MSDVVHVHVEGLVAVVTMMGDLGHSLTVEVVDGLTTAIARAAANEQCRAIVLRAEAGDFCQGLDLNLFRDGRRPSRDDLRRFAACLTQICRSRPPVVACVEGQTSGGGVGLVAACDLVLASATATFVLPELVVGLLPALVTPFLRRRLSLAQIRSLSLSSRTIDASEAHVLGLVDEVAVDVRERLNAQLRRLVCASPLAVAAAKRYFDRLDPYLLDAEVECAIDEAVRWIDTAATLEDVREFVDGGVPSWFPKGRWEKFV